MEVDGSELPIFEAEAFSADSLSDILSPPPMEYEEEDEPDFVRSPVRNSLAFFKASVPVRKASFSGGSLPLPSDLAPFSSSNANKRGGSGGSNNEWKEMENYIKVREKAKEMELKAQMSNRTETNAQPSRANPGKLNMERTKLFTDSLPLSLPPSQAPPKPRPTSPSSSLRGEYTKTPISPTSSLRNSPPSSPAEGKSPSSSSPSSPRGSFLEKKPSNSSIQIEELNLKMSQNKTISNFNNPLRKSTEVTNPNRPPLPVPRPIVPALLGSTPASPSGISSHRLSISPPSPSPQSTVPAPFSPPPAEENLQEEGEGTERKAKKASSRLFEKKMSLESGKYESDNSNNALVSPRSNANAKNPPAERRNLRKVSSNLGEMTRSASMENPSESIQKSVILSPYKSEDPRVLSLEAGALVDVLNDKMGEHWVQICFEGKTGLYPKKLIKIEENNQRPLATASMDSLPTLRNSTASNPLSPTITNISNGESRGKLERTLSSPSMAKDKSKDKEDKKKAKEKEKDDKKKKKSARKRDSEFDAVDDDDFLLREGTKKTWRGSTIERIIGKICSADDEQNLALTLAHSWSSILTVDELLDLLKERAKVMSRRTMMSEDIKNTAAPIILKIIEFMKLWLKADLPMLTQTGMIQRIKSFVDELALYQPVAANRILDEELGGLSGKSKINRTASLKWKPLKMSLLVESFNSLEDIDPEEMARQMTLIEHAQLSNISASEFMKQRWVKGKTEDAPVIHAMAESFNQTSAWISTLILTPLAVDQRAIMLSRWIYMAKTFCELGNFNGVLEVLSSLNSSAVFRLRQTWDLLPPKSVSIFNSLNKIMNPEGHYSAYKEAIKKCHPPIVPQMGLTLTDILMIDEGNPTYLAENNFVNIGKLELLSNNVKDIINNARQPYSLLKHDKIYEFLTKEKHVEEERDLYNMSLQREERKKKPPRVES
eukprot:TRINITY_DN5285_c0_g1_i1.p1 TRINITY_DN5285_c0_g1~~TRINITY_DN5285_c0_g1_i1.p1  ORF type:complete len:945 (+),score=355.88 TRINITY_DN5285_c0_g1_i1:302-3136(+)